MQTPETNIPLGIAWMVVTTFFFVGVTAIVRYLGSDMPAVEAAFIRYVIGLFLVLPALIYTLRAPLSKQLWTLFSVRALVHGGGVMLWFYAMARIPIAEVTAIGYTAPLWVAIGAYLFLGEALRLRRITAVLIGFIGVMIILRPGFESLNMGQLAQLLAAPLFAVSFLITKSLTRQVSSTAIVAMLSLGCTVVLLPGAVMQWRTPTVEEFLWLALTAVLATIGHYTLTQAVKYAPLTVTQPIGLLQLVWAMGLGMLVFGEALDPYVFIGGGIIVAAATYIAHRETVIARREKLNQ